MVTTIFLARHGATEWNATRRAQGQADIPLNDEGRSQAQDLAAKLASEPLAAVYSSDLARAADTAAALAEALGLTVELDPAFREIDQGDWEGLTTDEIKRRWPDLWGPARHFTARPGGESPADVRRRALEAIGRVVARHPCDSVAIVSHGGTIRWLSAEALGYDVYDSAKLRGLANGGYVSVAARLEDGTLTLDGLRRYDGRDVDADDPNL